MTIDDLLQNYREVYALTEREKGARFERLMKNFLRTYSIYRGKFSDVWLWKDFPYRHELGGTDLGIDLVAKTVDGEFYAVQCKFYADTSTIDKSAVDSFIANSARNFHVDGVEKIFSARIWISTTEKYTSNAKKMFKNQSPPVQMINLATLRRAQVNWTLLDNGFFDEPAKIYRELRDYQIDAVNAAYEHFQNNSRGQLIMACGTGKTFTSLKITEKIFPHGKILFLVPSISLLSQTLNEWAAFSEKPINAVCVCSDETVTQNYEDEITDVNLPLPAMTDANQIADALKNLRGDNLTVIFSTYQSIDKVAAVQEILNFKFDLIICDEAHRTTGFSDKADKLFTKVHDDEDIRADKKVIHADKRMYMTATPRFFKTDVQKGDDEKSLTVWSMNDESIFGKEFYRISFSKAVDLKILSDYKVFVYTVNETFLTPKLREAIHDKTSPLTMDETLKLIGVIIALSKYMDKNSSDLIKDDENQFMHSAVSFCQTIQHAEDVSNIFPLVQEKFLADMPEDDRNSFVQVKADYVFAGRRKKDKKKSADKRDDEHLSMSADERNEKLQRLKSVSHDSNICRILNNVRCLSEGVDVPALDAVIFLSPRKSKVEIIQAVGRVMRKAKGKKFGYIIIPVIVPIDKEPEIFLANSKDFSVVYDVLNSLRAHDDAMNVEIERIRNTGKSEKIIIGGGVPPYNDKPEKDSQISLGFLLRWDDVKNKMYARIVENLGNKLYWIQWAEKVKTIVERHTRRIKEIIDLPGPARTAFIEFQCGLQKNLNPTVTESDIVDMLAQHMVTRPIFKALFDNDSFAKNNPVSIAMQKILAELDKDGMSKDYEIFSELYAQVQSQCQNMGDAKQRQEIIIRLYDSFFKMALPITAQKLGIVYTPVEVVDFILNSVNDVLQKNFNRTLSDKNVHILDPFTGTGTFITRLLQSGLIRKKILSYKYNHEIHANEMVLLAYYIAAVNIENVFNAEGNDYSPFKGICFTDTFQTYEDDDNTKGQMSFTIFKDLLKKNSDRIQQQLDNKIEIIIGNPPYSVGQRSASDNAQNTSYDKLEIRIKDTYAAGTNANLKKALYDSYIKAFRWASDRIGESGVIGFVTNAGWLDGAAMDGLRKCFVKEFSEIYVFNLRGNQRTQGEMSRREGGKIFGSGSRAPIAITVLVKNPQHTGDAQIHYLDIGDYLSRDDKLARIKAVRSVLSDEFTIITPNAKGDWINQRGDEFENYLPLGDKDKTVKTFFDINSLGIITARDAWCYNFSRSALEKNIQLTIDYYNTHTQFDVDTTKITWTYCTVQNKLRKREYKFNAAQIIESFYRPFCRTNFYYDKWLNERVYQMPKLFPTGNEENLVICVSGIGGSKNFSVMIFDKITCLDTIEKGQCFPLYWYEPPKEINLFEEDNYERRDGVTDFILQQAQSMYGKRVTKEDIFYYVYGFLHLPSYREKFSAELKKSLPRIFLIDDTQKFWQLVKAGRE
ncbi:MAG: DEAD/DEAH box helicase, partial [Selenomonadaceae bacterium]|nr:DEAD/DEAH box helicase [Selenomonadaceae bacterium]